MKKEIGDLSFETLKEYWYDYPDNESNLLNRVFPINTENYHIQRRNPYDDKIDIWRKALPNEY